MKKRITVLIAAILVLVICPVLVYTMLSDTKEKAETLQTKSTAQGTKAPARVTQAGDSEVTQDSIYDRMLNSVDYFNAADVTFHVLEPSIPEPKIVTIETNLNDSTAHQTVLAYKNQADLDNRNTAAENVEDFCDGEYVIQFNHTDKSYFVKGTALKRTEPEEEYSATESRYFLDNDGIANYQYRINSTNADMASYCLTPQELAFGLLTDKSLWEISGTQQYQGRAAVVLKGTATEAYGAQLNIAEFELIVDIETGILLKYEGINEYGEVTSYTEVTALRIDAPAVEPDYTVAPLAEYADYTELDGLYYGVLD